MRNAFENPFIIAIFSAPFKVTPEGLLLEGVALVVELLAAAHAEVDLYAPVLEENLERYERKPLRLCLELEVAHFLRVHEELSHRLRFVVEAVAELVGSDVRPDEPKLALQDGAVAPRERHLAVAHALDLGARKHYTALDRLEHGIVMSRLPVLGEDRIELLVGHRPVLRSFSEGGLVRIERIHVDVLLVPLGLRVFRSGNGVEVDFSDKLALCNLAERDVALVLVSSRSRLEMRFTSTGTEGIFSWAFFKSSLFISVFSPVGSAYYIKLFHFAVAHLDIFLCRKESRLSPSSLSTTGASSSSHISYPSFIG